jgi:hypothetical protein
MAAPDLAEIAGRHGVSAAAVDAVMRSLRASGGASAQFNHPDLGGSGQWMPGMTQIGDMFNSALRSRVDALCAELADHLGTSPPASPWPGRTAGGRRRWARRTPRAGRAKSATPGSPAAAASRSTRAAP